MKEYKKILIIIFFIVGFFGFINADFVSADSNDLLFGGQEEAVGEVIGLGDTDPRILIANIIRIILGFLGIIAVILTMYAGWLYMTAAGEEDKIDQAKKILIGAVIGLVIILSSFALATFVLDRLYDATGSEGGSGGCNPPCLPGYCCVAGSCESCGTIPHGTNLTSNILPPDGSDYYPMNTIGLVRFNKGVDSQSGSFNDGGQNLSVNFSDEKRLEFTSQATCAEVAAGTEIIVPENWQDKFCFDPDIDYAVAVSGYESLIGGQVLNCSIGCVSNFRVSAEIDVSSPEISINQGRSMCANYDIEISASATDDFGISEMSFFVYNEAGAELFNYSSSPYSLTKRFSDTISLSNIIIAPGQYSVRVLAIDVVGNESERTRPFTVWPDHCCNGQLDGVDDSDLIDPARPEIDIDCGGECGACEGGSCAVDMDSACVQDGGENCSTNLCSGSLLCNCESNDGENCTEAGYYNIEGNPYQISEFSKCCICRNWPVIEDVSPSGGGICVNTGTGSTNNTPCLGDNNCGVGEVCDLLTLKNFPNGAIGSMVTINGDNFGENPGQVYFCRNMGLEECIDWAPAGLAESVNSNCVNSWQDNMIIAIVPPGAVSGPIRIITENGFEDSTNNEWGRSINDFLINNFARPGICSVENNNASGQACVSDEACAPYECLKSGSVKTCSKNQGYFEEVVNYQGVGLSEGSKAYFGDLYKGYEEAYYGSSSFSGLNGVAQIPNIQNKKTTTFVINNNLLSNNLDFYKIGESNVESKIIYFDPIIGKEGQYITIHGQGFGRPNSSQIGINYKVFFDNDISNNNINDEDTLGVLADFNFPDVCDIDSLWREESILVKTPKLDNGSYYLVIKIDSKVDLIDSSEVDDTVSGYEKTFLYNSSYPLTPGLCAINPRSGQRNSEFNLYGENMGANQSHRILFGGSYIDAFNFSLEDDAQKINSIVPDTAVDGYNKVSVLQKSGITCSDQADCNVGWSCFKSECQVLGNSLVFKVGECDQDSECGSGYYCCDSGSFARICQAGSDKESACLKSFGACVYEFDFSTGQLSPPPLETESCLGFGADECGYNFCPNSPGWCSYDDSPQGDISNDCDDAYCDNLYSGTSYNNSLNRCSDGNQCGLSEDIAIQYNNQNYSANKYCDTYNSSSLWHYKLSGGTCEIFGEPAEDWVNIGDNICVHLNETCLECAEGMNCFNDNGNGVCAYDRRICSSGYECNANEQCEREKDPCCDCCCDINRNTDNGNPGCCAPLKCDFDCGEGERDVDNDGTIDIDFGLCTGCTIRNQDGSVNIEASDNACNCSESDISGKYCDASAADGLGVCRDCASLQDDADDCSEHNTCCVDNKNNDNCRGLKENYIIENEIRYCAYYSCGDDGAGNEICLSEANIDGDYSSSDCNNACGRINGSKMGSSCYHRNDLLNINECTYDFCPDFICLDENGNEAFLEDGSCINGGDPSEQNCGICCCDPNSSEDKCALVDESLSCLENVSPCAGENRGMCCGCSEDSDCSLGDPDNIGCGDDSCCRARPEVYSYYPGNDETEVCRNTLIQATFNQKIDEGSVLGNFIVIGDYGLDPCPDNTNYLVYKNGTFEQPGFLTRFLVKLFKPINKIIKPITGKNAFAANNFCAISGSTASSYNPLSDQTTVDFNLDHLLEGDRDYYVVIKGDRYLNSSAGVLNFWGIGMVENNETIISTTNGFNGLDFTSSKIWKFTAGRNICTLNSVDIKPDKYVFKLDDRDITVLGKTQDFTAYAKTSQDDIISSTVEYGWTWNWTIDNSQVVDFQGGQLPSDNPQTVVAQNQQDASTYINAEAVISTAPTDMSSFVGRSVGGKELIRVFACNNPWPPIENGVWEPWIDTDACTQDLGGCINANYEIYYCRDSGGFGTADDLPAILSDTITIGHPFDSQILKESYFFREAVPEQMILFTLPSPAEGKKVSLRWSELAVEPGEVLDYYKIYYGERSGQYTKSATTNNLGYIIDGLVNDREYYFVITAVYESGAEGKFSNEVIGTPKDSVGPISPLINEAVAGDQEVRINWQDASNGDAVAFRIYYVALDDDETCDINTAFGGSVSVPYSASATTTVSNLNSGADYCFGMVGYDDSGNSSAVSAVGPVSL